MVENLDVSKPKSNNSFMWQIIEKVYENKKTLIIFRAWEMFTCTMIVIVGFANLANIYHHW
jgi:hypothetical protein